MLRTAVWWHSPRPPDHATVRVRSAPVGGFELRYAEAFRRGGRRARQRPILLGGENHSSKTTCRLCAGAGKILTLLKVQRDEFSLRTSKFESDMASHAVSLGDVCPARRHG